MKISKITIGSICGLNIGPAISSLFACSEIVVATVVSAIWLGNKFFIMDVIGFILVTSTVFLLTFQKHKG